tara:strand:- start:1899 stop:3449 length:1551 start_codon:yes stop_codon:yes gene_type:complete
MSKKINLINGNFITLDDSCPHAESISIENGKICGINAIDHNCENLNLKGATIIPGFIDAHFHLTNLGKQLDTLQLKNCKSKYQIADLVLEKSNELDEEDWIVGFGWDQTRWLDSSFPKKEILNDLNIKNPVFLTRIDGHSSWVNDISMKLSGLNIKADPPEGGKIINDCILIDNAMNPVKNLIPKSEIKTIEKWMKLAFDIIVKRGITNIHDAWQDPITIDILKKIDSNGELPIRCYGMIGSSHDKFLNQFLKNGKYVSEKYTIRSVKAFIDGALGSRGAALLEPYSDDLNNCGLILIETGKFIELAKKCKNAGFQLCTHAIGDKGNKMVLDIYSKTITSSINHRWRIEHAQMVSNEDVPKFFNNGIIPSMQPSHCTSDMRWLDDRIGEKRFHRISRWKTFIDSGCKIPGGSDCPIEEGNPLFEYYAAITRKNHDGFPENGWESQECVNRLDALKMFTTWAAHAEFSEHKRGKIRPGFDADLTVLSNDLINCNPEEILNIEILGTMVAGNFVYLNF